MLGLPQKTIESIKKHLMKQQVEVEKSLQDVEKDDPATDGGLAEASEPGTDSYIADTHTRSLALEDQLKKVGNDIKNALGKIKNGTYGKCENCGKQIEINRLMAMPTASLCLSCSSKPKKH